MGSGVDASSASGSSEGWRELNRDNWDARVPVHLASSSYDIDGYLAGADSLLPFEGEEAGDVASKHLVHLQCHIGLDTLSWAQRGAVVSGLDFSSAAVKAARSLATSVGIPASFVEADVYDAVAAFGGQRFDIVYTGIGALVWLPSVTRWTSVVASLLAPGGFLYLVEGHPFAQVLDDSSGVRVARDYFDSAGHMEDYPFTYTDGPALSHTVGVEFQHGIGSIITALTETGLRIEFVHEYDFEAFQRFESLERGPEGLYRFSAGQPRIPMMYSLRASRAG
jgi:SAM-dependent methyltransferase